MLKLDIGCGGRGSRWPGFLGIDIHPRPSGKTGEEYLRLDIVNEPLPWSDGSVDEIISLHCIEHMTREDGLKMLTRIMRLLKPGAGATITCPDLRKLCKAYLASNEAFWAKKYKNDRYVWPGDTLGDRLNWAIHQETHKWSYDSESLVKLAALAARASGVNVRIKELALDSPYSTRPDHEIGIVITRAS
jgi:predicted SAM-dependent methyltransferase